MRLFEIVSAVKERGLRFFYDYFFESILFDLINRTDTSRRIVNNQGSHADLAIPIDGVHYVASFTSVIIETLRYVRENLDVDFDRYQFVDLGCGKGKAVLIYVEKFKQPNGYPAIGIEYDKKLCNIATDNLSKMGLGHGYASIICDDAANLTKYNATEKLIVFMYNPFGRDTMIKVLTNISRFPHWLIYVDPAHQNLLEEFGYKVLKRKTGRYKANTWLIAEHAF